MGRPPPRLAGRRVGRRGGLRPARFDCRYLSTPHERPVFFDHGHYIHITTYAPREDEEGEVHAVECVVGENWVVTAHDQAISVLEEFADRVSGSGDTGTLDGPSFLAALLEWVLGPTPPRSSAWSSGSRSSTSKPCAETARRKTSTCSSRCADRWASCDVRWPPIAPHSWR